MFRRTIGAALAAAAITAAALIIKELDKETEVPEEEDDDSVHFVDLDDSEDEVEYPEEVKEIAEVYPYLEPWFISEQLNRNDAFNREYPEDTLITITHKAKFDDAETAEDYLNIAVDNGYKTEKLSDVESLIIKKMFTADGVILSDIYNVANQVACLRGQYEGYKID